MKNLSKISVIILLVTMVGFSSCVKTEVSPEVTALRQSQVDKLKADIAAILANTSYKNIQSRQLKMEITFDSLFNAFDLRRDEAQYLVTLQTMQNQLEIERRLLAQNQLATAQAIATYENFIASGKFNQNVSDLLNKYTTETNNLNTLYNERITLTKDIADKELLLDASTHLSWDFLKAGLEVQLADKEAELSAKNAALVALEGVYDDPATLESAKTDLRIEIEDLTDQSKALDVLIQEATNVETEATAEVTAATTVIGLMDNATTGYVKQLADKNTALLAKNAQIVTQTTTVTTATNTLALSNADVASKTSTLASATSAYNAKLALYNTALTNDNNALNNVDAKLILWNIAQNNLAANPTDAALIAAEAAANTAYTDALTAQAATATALTDATTAKNNAMATMNTAQAALTTAQGIAATDKAALTTAQATLNTYTNDKAGLETDIVKITDLMANIQADYDAAKANLETLRIAVNTATIAKNNLVAEKTPITAMITALTSVHTVLSTQYTNIVTVINTLKTAVTTLETAVATLETSIGNNEINRAKTEDEIARLQAMLASNEIKITESEGIAAYWKKLLDEAIAEAGA